MPGRKSKSPQILEDIANANIPLQCDNPECRHEFYKKGAWLQKNHIFGCPQCEHPFVFDDEKLLHLFSNYVKNTGEMIDRMRGQ